MLPIDNSNVIDLSASTTIVWPVAPGVVTTFGAWIQDYIQNYGPQGGAVNGFVYNNSAQYRALGLFSESGNDFFIGPSSVDLRFDGTSYRALVIGVNTVLFEFNLGSAPEPVILPDFSFGDPNKIDSRVRISRSGEQIICTAGKYFYGMPGEKSEAPMNGVTYSLYLDDVLIKSAVGDGSVHAFDTSSLNGAKGHVTCELQLSIGGATLRDKSNWNSMILSNAQSTKANAVFESGRANAFALSKTLANLNDAKNLIRSSYTAARELRNAGYEITISKLKRDLESGVITTKSFISLLRELNSSTLILINESRTQKVMDLEANIEARSAAERESQSALLKELEALNAEFAKMLEDTGYAVTLS